MNDIEFSEIVSEIVEAAEENSADRKMIRATGAEFGYDQRDPIDSIAGALVERGYTMSKIRCRFW